MNLIGTGNVVITDIRQTSAGMILSEELAGRLFIRDEKNQLVAELQKPAGRAIELGLEPGKYTLDLQRKPEIATAAVELKTGERLILKNSAFQSIPSEEATSRGEPGVGTKVPQPIPVLTPRFRSYRIELGVTGWPNPGGTTASPIESTVGANLACWYRPRPNLAVGVAFYQGPSGVGSGVSGVFSLTPAVRYYLSKSALATALNPYLKVGVGPYFGSQVGPGVKTLTAFGASFGGGLDLRLSRGFFLYVDGGYHALTDFSSPIGGRKNYSGAEMSVGLAWQFGKPVPIQEKP
jgi:hypothetical protein